MKYLHMVVALAAIGVTGAVAAEDCPSGPEGNLCKAERGERHAMYMVARAAYIKENEAIKNGATVVDFSDAYKWAWKAHNLGFAGGDKVLKMIYLNATAHNDPVEAHRWLTRALNDGEDYLILWQQRLEGIMSQEQIQEADSKTLD